MIRGFNLTDVTGSTTDYPMNSIVQNSAYPIPSYGDGSYTICWRYNDNSTGYRFKYTDSFGSIVTTSNIAFASGSTNAIDNIKRIKCGFTDLSDEYSITNADLTQNLTMQVMNGGTVLAEYIFQPVSCNGNEMYPVEFLNAWGVWDRFFFRGRKDDETEITSDDYKFNKINYVDMTYNVSDGSYHKYNVQGRDKITLQSDWLMQEHNRKMKELLLSEKVIIGDYPFIITNTSEKFKTIRYDKKIEYTLELKYAADTINNIK